MAKNKVMIVFAGGGTGGHLFPAIAIADRISQLLENTRETEIIFVGTVRGIEYRRRDSLGYPLELINIRGLTRSFTWKNLLVPFIAVRALFKASALLKRLKPAIVIGTGGYVSWPVIRTASKMGINTVLQEQNSYPGLTTRKLAPLVRKIYLGFEEAKNFLSTDAEIRVTGNPVRSEIVQGDREVAIEKYGLERNRRTIVIMGGSQGARAINRAVLRSLENDVLGDKYQVLWQTGRREYREVNAMAGRKAFCSLFPFAEDMSLVYAAADIIIARAGALTLAEISACGIPSILIPYPFAAGDHQKKNAQAYVARGTAVLIDQDKLEQENILEKACLLLSSPEHASMKEAARKQTASARAAVDLIASDIINILNEGSETGD